MGLTLTPSFISESWSKNVDCMHRNQCGHLQRRTSTGYWVGLMGHISSRRERFVSPDRSRRGRALSNTAAAVLKFHSSAAAPSLAFYIIPCVVCSLFVVLGSCVHSSFSFLFLLFIYMQYACPVLQPVTAGWISHDGFSGCVESLGLCGTHPFFWPLAAHLILIQ